MKLNFWTVVTTLLHEVMFSSISSSAKRLSGSSMSAMPWFYKDLGQRAPRRKMPILLFEMFDCHLLRDTGELRLLQVVLHSTKRPDRKFFNHLQVEV